MAAKKKPAASNSGAMIDRRKVVKNPAVKKVARPKMASQTKSTRIPGGAIADPNKISVYEYNDQTGREDLVGSVGRYDTSLGFGADGGKWRFVRPSSKSYAQGYRTVLVKNGRANKAKPLPKGKK